MMLPNKNTENTKARNNKIMKSTYLQIHIKKGFIQPAKKIIKKNHDLIDTKDDFGKTPLHYAILYNSTEIAVYLIEKCANLNTQDNNGDTPLHLAIKLNNNKIAFALINKRANVNIKDRFGNSPLYLAYKSNNENKQDIIKTLIENGGEQYNTNKVILLIASIIAIIATPSLITVGILFPHISIILFGCSGTTLLSSIILLDSYFKAPEYIAINKSLVKPINKTGMKEDIMTKSSEKKRYIANIK